MVSTEEAILITVAAVIGVIFIVALVALLFVYPWDVNWYWWGGNDGHHHYHHTDVHHHDATYHGSCRSDSSIGGGATLRTKSGISSMV